MVDPITIDPISSHSTTANGILLVSVHAAGHVFLGGGFKYGLFSPRKLGKITISTIFFPRGWFNHELVITY